MKKKVGTWRSITTDYDNETKDTGRVVIAWVCVTVLLVLAFMLFVALRVVIMSSTHTFDFFNFGGGVGAVLGGFATLLGALSVYVLADNKNRPDPPPAPPPAPYVPKSSLSPSVLNEDC